MPACLTIRQLAQIRSMDDCKTLGVRTAFVSNSFAAYRRTSLDQVGGFPAQVFVSEEVFVTSRLLLAGWKSPMSPGPRYFTFMNSHCVKSLVATLTSGLTMLVNNAS